jgi:splicing factor 3A subunit 2
MDYQNRVGSKKGSGGVAGTSETNQYRRERLKNLLQSKINIDTDPYVFKNHLGILECKLCFTTHMSESNYITHTTARRHQLNLMRRADFEKRQKQSKEDKEIEEVIQKRYWKKIGKPVYKVNKIRDPINLQKGLLFTLKFDHIKDDVQPLYKFLPSNKTQKEEPDSKYQYLIISAEPYDNIGFKIPNEKIDTSGNSLWNYWDPDTKEYCLQFFYLNK